MPFQVSPGVNVSEIDLTTVIPAVSTTEGAIAGRFSWGPAGKRVLVDSEDVLAANFGKPSSTNDAEWFTAANFLAYGNQLYVSRVLNSANNSNSSGATTINIINEDDYNENHSTGIVSAGNWTAKYPGALGNSLKVSICQSSTAFESQLASILTLQAGNTVIDSTADLQTTVAEGDIITISNTGIVFSGKVTAVGATSVTVETAPTTEDLGGSSQFVVSSGDMTRRWEFFNNFDRAPGTSTYATARGGSGDELHVAVVDEDGLISGVKGTVLEAFSNVSRASDAKSEDGAGIYYKEYINQRSAYIWWTAHDSIMSSAGSLATTSFTNSSDEPITESLTGGSDGNAPSNAQIIDGYNLFRSPEDVDVSLILGADANQTVAIHLINNIAEVRKDCLVCLSPERADVVNNSGFSGAEVEDIIAFRNLLPSSSYAVMDSSWKYQYDKYNDVYRYVPLNGDTAGLMVRTDTTRDPWFSPAGFNRGNVKNIVKLAFNPRKAERDLLYKNGINPVVSFPGQGTVLFGDKTMLSKPSAFNRINVRRLFIVLEKAISTASKFTLFEFNDDFTRSQFRNLVEPFLRDVQGRRGIFDFRVVCDETNNTGEVIDRNEFIGDIYIKPARSINFIQLNFVAVRTGVDFEEVVGQF